MNRVVFVTGDKGGVGKSFLSRTLMGWYQTRGTPVHGFDTDKTNSTFYRFFAKDNSVGHLDVDAPESLDQLINLITSGEDKIILIDCAARTMDQLLTWMREIDFLGLKEEYKFQITLAFVMGPEKDCVAILKDIYGSFQNTVDYIVVKNMAKGRAFDIYDNSTVRKELLEKAQAQEMELPALFDRTAMLVDRLNLSFETAINHKDVQIADRQRIKAYSARTKALFDQGVPKWT